MIVFFREEAFLGITDVGKTQDCPKNESLVAFVGDLGTDDIVPHFSSRQTTKSIEALWDGCHGYHHLPDYSIKSCPVHIINMCRSSLVASPLPLFNWGLLEWNVVSLQSHRDGKPIGKELYRDGGSYIPSQICIKQYQ